MERNLSSRLWRAIYERARLCLILTGSVCALPVAIVLSLIAPIYRVRSGFLFVDRIGHFAFDAEYYLSGIASDKVSQKCGHDIFFYEGKLSNEQLSRMFRRHVWTSGLVRFLYTANTWLPWATKQNITPARMRNGSRDLEGNFRRVEHQLKFTDWEDRQGHAALAEFGMSHSDYFVCLQIRDPAYLGSTRPESNWSYHSYRDCDIRTYHSTVRELVKHGYWVFRMGKNVQHPLLIEDERVVDYANHPKRSDFLDVWLMANCHFAISSGTGLDSVSDAFRRPILYTNYDVFHLMVTWSMCLTVPKRLLWRKTGEELSIAEYFDYGFAHSRKYEAAGIQIVDLEEHEITSATREMISWLEGDINRSSYEADIQQQFWREYARQPKFPQFHGQIHPQSRIGSEYLKSYISELIRPAP